MVRYRLKVLFDLMGSPKTEEFYQIFIDMANRNLLESAQA